MSNLSYELLYECTHWWFIIGMLMLINMMLYDVSHRWWIFWNYMVESLLCCCCCCCRWCHSYHVDLRAYALHVDLRAYALHVDLMSRCSTRWIASLCSNTLIGTTYILHSQVGVVSLHYRVVIAIVELLSYCRWFNAK